MAAHGDRDEDPDSPEAQVKNQPRPVEMEGEDALGTDEEERSVYMRDAHKLNSTCLLGR